MTIQTGEFAHGAMLAGLPGDLRVKLGDAPEQPIAAPDAENDGDLGLYLRHVEGGESIRAIARDLGCHASTVMRRIRRFEMRRDDPLVDQGVERAALQPQPAAPGTEGVALGRTGMNLIARILRRLAEPGAQLVVADGMDKAIVVRDEIRTAILDRALAEHMAIRGWVQLVAQGRMGRYVISSQGREALRGLLAARRGGPLPQGRDFALAEPVQPKTAGMAEEAAGFDHADKHRIWDAREINDPEDGRRRRARINIAESPLLMLARRREPDGSPFLTAGMVSAGERLREDFELAQMGPRVTQNWDGFLTSGVDVSRGGAGFGGGSDSARNRVASALRELGPGLGDMCLRVCCFLEGIEMTERRLGWSARSGKIVLRLALMRLERHYRENYGLGAPLIG
ncbi:DUF6456 domain-containing protein [Paracoccus laeviglucosivorans]|uniref:Helix-turn-helix domain-containing protein n=1 Tax=Paracoccus laeviglucosivorans TaxID=1197861 RepID=A0A521BWM3_9RHOB|nr:DUF6456 domain-containing protein [Paracoccus laeviglucosivorans]SMO51475.1 Helix-turn-helix domain-containing protein [Paracoccus laeviglucosivorans]